MRTVKEALDLATVRLEGDTPALDAQLLMMRVLDRPRTWLYAWPEARLTAEQLQMFNDLVERRAHGEPIAYLIGHREFWTLDLVVTPAVLIPRPETELLVQLALQLGAERAGLVADLGTGSGAVALALAAERMDWQVVATDASKAALAVASINVQHCGFANIRLRHGSWCEPLEDEQYLLIVSNPPYIAPTDAHLTVGDVRFEPRGALVAADDGLADIRTIAACAHAKLDPGGWLLLEHGWQQGAAVRAILQRHGYANIATHRDPAGHERVTIGSRPSGSPHA